MVKNLIKSKIKDAIREVARDSAQIIYENFWFIFILFFMNVFTETLYRKVFTNQYGMEKIIFYFFICFFLIFCIATVIRFIKNKMAVVLLKSFIILITACMFLAECFTLYYYKVLIGPGIIQIILGTNLNEAKDFLSVHIEASSYIFITCALGSFFCLKKWIPLKREGFIKKKWFVFAILFCGLLLSIRFLCIHQPMRAFLFPRIYLSTTEAIKSVNEYKKLSSQIKNDPTIIENNAQIKNVILILGESTNRHHMGLYGYYLNTTPALKRLREDNELCVFQDVISPHALTTSVIQKLFTFSNYESKTPWYKQGNLISILNAAGYKTYWLSNQEKSGWGGNVTNVFSSVCSEKMFTAEYKDTAEDYALYDGEILPLLEKGMNEDEDINFFVIHLMGAHQKYKNRYPEDYDVFKTEDIVSSLGPNKKKIIAEYDNAVLYTDEVVSRVIEKFRNKEAVVIYIADHGEEIYDFRDFADHFDENVSRYMLEIPMIVWSSEAFKEKFPDKWKSIEDAVNKPYMTDDMIHTLLDLLDIKTVESDETRSLFNVRFDEQRKRFHRGQDYDREMKDNPIKSS